uniref:Uncharacterized protein n=1 Tax=Arundo donax TaxID=35708 RepID=A0A0A9HS19_ARUDO
MPVGFASFSVASSPYFHQSEPNPFCQKHHYIIGPPNDSRSPSKQHHHPKEHA